MGVVPPAPSTLLQARPQGGLTQLLTEVARQREEAAQLRLKVTQAPPSIPEKPGVPKQDEAMLNWLHTQKGPGTTSPQLHGHVAEARPMVQHLPLKLPQDLRETSESTNGLPNEKGQPKLKAAPKARRTSPKKNLEASRRDETCSTTRSSAPRRSRPTSPSSPSRSSAGHAQAAPRLCISVPEHRLKPPEPQFLFSLPLRVYSGPKKLVDLSFKGSRSGSPSRTDGGLSESPRSFMWSALEQEVPPRASQNRSPPRERGAPQVIQPQPAVRSASAATPSVPCGSARGLSVVSTPASHAGVSTLPMPTSNFAWNAGATPVQAAVMAPAVAPRSVSPAVYMQPRSISPPNVPQMRYLSPPPVMGR